VNILNPDAGHTEGAANQFAAVRMADEHYPVIVVLGN
jgi:hypothetical protein